MTKQWIFDASTIILLAKITLLRNVALAKIIILPEAVWKEINQKKEAYDTQIIEQLISEKMIRTASEKTQSLIFEKEFGLGKGESEALALAHQQKAKLATDDLRAIKASKVFNIPFATAIHFLIDLTNQGVISKEIAKEKLQKLEKYGRYGGMMLQDAKKRIEGGQYG
ncbi:hypothetical protein HYS47_01055 [Candidatus Woesearchaeota archaeon]|nr:hypothetical protein [Candidatus Woesearchaeota archaeon]